MGTLQLVDASAHFRCLSAEFNRQNSASPIQGIGFSLKTRGHEKEDYVFHQDDDGLYPLGYGQGDDIRAYPEDAAEARKGLGQRYGFASLVVDGLAARQ